MVYKVGEQVSEESLRAVASLTGQAQMTENDYARAFGLNKVSRQGLIKSYWRVVLVALGAGALGVGLTIMALTMYQDHLKTNAMWEYMVKQSQTQAAKAPQPTPQSTPSK